MAGNRTVRLGVAVVALLAVIAAALYLRSSLASQADKAVDPAAGWPEQLAMTCADCSAAFGIPSAQYRQAVEARREGGDWMLICPKCGSKRVQRTENLSRDRTKFRSGE